MRFERLIPFVCLVLLPFISIRARAGDEPAALLFDEIGRYERLDRWERENYEALRFLMNDQQKRQYLRLATRAERDRWLAIFWKLHDPTPATAKNERRVEHEERAKQARKQYPSARFPFVDGRGETLIRFGEPDYIHAVDGNLVSVEQRLDWFRFKMPGEVWFYNRIDIVVPFEEVKLDGECTYLMEINTIDRNMREFHAQYSPGGLGLLASEGWFALNEYLNYNPGNVLDLEYTDVEELNNFYAAVEDDRFVHAYDLDNEPIRFYHDVCCFRGGSGVVRTEVNVEIPTSELTFREEEWEHRASFELLVTILDREMRDVVSARKTSRLSFKELDPEAPALIPAQFTFSVDPGYYRICVEARDGYSRGHGCYRSSRNIRMVGESLDISDLLFASSIGPAGDGDTFVRGTLRVVPHPMRAYRRPGAIEVYYEIYGLDTDDGDVAFYSVEYSITPLEKRRSGLRLVNAGTVISSRFRTSAYGRTQRERIEIDTGELWEGAFRLSVEVTDERTKETVTAEGRFSVVE
ncbi:MAG: GWxTD domain-containing protein [Candidatus Krumholzibacteriota bacterium]|nr:GWxTD domain-containing protein [Candidatus Krumholzibacteriota bacterium]